MRAENRIGAAGAWLPPLAAWAAALAVLCGAALATGHDPLRPSSWTRYDSYFYKEIARSGYEEHRCTNLDDPRHRTKWCGNTAWFPAYPIAMRAVSLLGVSLGTAGLVVSWLAALATLLLVWRWFLPPRIPPLLCAAFAPGVVYLYAIFPLSLLTLAGTVFLRHLDRRRWLAAAAGVVATLAYPLGIALVPLVAVVHAVRGRRARSAVADVAVLAGPAIVAGLLFVLVQRLQTGSWTAYADVAGTYGGLHDPVTSVTDQAHILAGAKNPFAYALAAVWQFWLVTVLLAASTAAAIRRRRGATLVAWCLGVWFVPLLQTGQSLWRSEAALVLMAPLVALLPRRVVWVAAAALIVVAYGLAHEFFAGTLI